MWALTCGLFFVGWLRDLIVILSGEGTDAKGRRLRSDVSDREGQSEKSLMVAVILCAFLGLLGVHRFYMGKAKTGILWACTLGLGGVGWLTDLCLLLREETVDAAGRPIRHVMLPPEMTEPGSISPKSRRTTLLLSIFLGFTGAHRYYIGKLGSGLLWSSFTLAWIALGAFGIGFGEEWLESLTVFGLGWFVDILMVLCGDATDANGLLIRNWEANETGKKDPNLFLDARVFEVLYAYGMFSVMAIGISGALSISGPHLLLAALFPVLVGITYFVTIQEIGGLFERSNGWIFMMHILPLIFVPLTAFTREFALRGGHRKFMAEQDAASTK